MINPELRKFEEQANDMRKEQEDTSKELVGTAANSTKVLSSGRVVGKPSVSQAKQEWMQARKNKYQRDKKGHIIDDKQGKEGDKGKGKTKLEEVTTRNKFNELEVEEVTNPPLQITEGKGDDQFSGNKKEQKEKNNPRWCRRRNISSRPD